MPLHSFDFSDEGGGKKLTSTQFQPQNGDKIEQRPAIATAPLYQDDMKYAKKTNIFFENQNINIAEDVHEILPQGFRTMDRGIKNYFSGIRVPTTDSIKLLQVRMAGGDKPYQIWAADIKRGRVFLPCMSIKRENDEAFPEKFSPAHYHYMAKRFVDQDLTRIALSYRPLPMKISYTLSVWAESKRDLEYINYQIRTRFHPVAEFLVEDEHFRASILLHFNGATPHVDDDVPADQRGNKRYDFAIQMEGYLPLPEKVVPSVLGKVTTLKDGGEQSYGTVLQTMQGRLVP